MTDFNSYIRNKINNIEIQIYTNIEGKEKTPFKFTRSMLLNQPKNAKITGVHLKEYPLFIPDYRIMINKMKNISYTDKINIIFNEDLYIDKIMPSISMWPTEVTEEEKFEQNIKSLLEILFPTTYPIENNHTDTFSELIEGNLPNTTNFSSSVTGVTSFISSFFKKKGEKGIAKKAGIEESTEELENNSKFSYLNIDGKIYTVLKVVYLNDFINNPKYKEILTGFFKINKWKKRKSEEIEKDILKMKREIVEMVDDLKYVITLPSNKCDFFTQLKTQYVEGTRDGRVQVKNKMIINIFETITAFLGKEESELPEIKKKMCDNDKLTKIKNSLNNIKQRFSKLKYNVNDEAESEDDEEEFKKDQITFLNGSIIKIDGDFTKIQSTRNFDRDGISKNISKIKSDR